MANATHISNPANETRKNIRLSQMIEGMFAECVGNQPRNHQEPQIIDDTLVCLPQEILTPVSVGSASECLVPYTDISDLYADLSNGLYYVLSHTPDIQQASYRLNRFKEKLAYQPQFCLPEEQTREIYFLLDRVDDLYDLHQQIGLESDASRKEDLQIQYREKVLTLSHHAPAMVHEFLYEEWRSERYQNFKEEMTNRFPYDPEMVDDYLERFVA